ncbi:2-phospho-L-lactate guanylyltransferase [Noviherbaspirillum sedimenti]|uniref:3-phospho-D-glycerate guanylyltransferase n=1 Tax=Noviherbaspirillum sedimenti TaxID=2320865 RepID=A0A3A3G3L2_9BURK|nr:2-phospho-L-lactate guanylyltransferase [Noviherbaspirillum sedimenti]RJG03078.1 2-phospho-L-lactate guanylyltransferase [Noviherbaspirillum sedimenti]
MLAVLPLKSFALAKSRLSGVLDASLRARLMRAMACDVLEALLGCARIKRIVVLSDDLEAKKLACGYGVEWQSDRSVSCRPGLNGGLRGAAINFVSQGENAMLVVHGDLPLLTSGEIDDVVSAWEALSGPKRVALVPSADRQGTHIVLAGPPDALDFQFGPNSFALHAAQAHRKGLSLAVLNLAGAGADVDTERDLRRLTAARTVGAHTRRVLPDITNTLETSHWIEEHVPEAYFER